MHVVVGASIRAVARQLGCSKNTTLSDLYHEGRRRANELAGTFVPYHLARPERVVLDADVRLLLAVWDAIDQRKMKALQAALEAQNRNKVGQPVCARVRACARARTDGMMTGDEPEFYEVPHACARRGSKGSTRP